MVRVALLFFAPPSVSINGNVSACQSIGTVNGRVFVEATTLFEYEEGYDNEVHYLLCTTVENKTSSGNDFCGRICLAVQSSS